MWRDTWGLDDHRVETAFSPSALNLLKSARQETARCSLQIKPEFTSEDTSWEVLLHLTDR